MTIFGIDIGQKMLEMFTGWLKDLVSIFIAFLENTLFNYDGLSGQALNAYELFAYLGGVLLVSVALGKVISQMIATTDTSQEADIWWVLVQSVKAGALLVIMPFSVSFVMKRIVKPIGTYFVEGIGALSIENIEGIENSESFKSAFDGSMSMMVLWLGVLVVLAFFVIKMFIIQAQLLMNEILSPLIAISIITDKFNFVETWWRDILSHVLTLVTLTLSMLLFIEALALDHDLIWTKLPALIGSGALVISGPTIIKNIWFSSGAGRGGVGVARTLLNYSMFRGRAGSSK